MIGERFGLLTVVGESKIAGRWHLTCQCECGAMTTVDRGNARAGRTASCGCRVRKLDGKWDTPTYRSWKAMRERCCVPTAKDYPVYGARGIRVDERWVDDFLAFLADMGERPEGTTLDRIDVFGNYEPGNCRWATPVQQSANRKNTLFLTANGETAPLSEWARRLGVERSTLRNRKLSGWTDEQTATTPARTRTKKPVATAEQ